MFEGGTLKLFAAITLFVAVTMLLANGLVRLPLGGAAASRAVAQSIAGLIGLAVSVGFLYAIG
jgi:type III secretory pathway component EscU